jgi:hypothetical protein
MGVYKVVSGCVDHTGVNVWFETRKMDPLFPAELTVHHAPPSTYVMAVFTLTFQFFLL